jgi:TP901 family phage tail tape measure protein
MKDVQAVSGESADSMQKLTDLALEMGKKTAFSSAQAAEGIEELVKAGVSVTDILNGGLKAPLTSQSLETIESCRRGRDCIDGTQRI